MLASGPAAEHENPMQNAARINLLVGVARSFSALSSSRSERPVSILSMAAASYGSRPSGDATVPTGFDPRAIALFEAIVEGAYVVANADGVFDAVERYAFERVVVAACGGAIVPQQIETLVSELEERLRQDGIDQRILTIARTVTKKEHAREILRIAALLAQASEDVSTVERGVLVKLAASCGLEEGEVDVALANVARLLSAETAPR
jgi:tellurite resistance protein